MRLRPEAQAWKLALVVGLSGVGAYFLLPGPGAKDIGYSVIGGMSVGAVLLAVRWHRPVIRRGWYAIAAGNACFVLGDGVYDLYQFVLHRATPFPSTADAFYLAGYPFLIIGVVCLTREAARAVGSRESYADAAIVTFGALALSWHFLIASYAQNPTLGVFGKLVTFAYPAMDLGVVFIVVRGLIFGRSRNTVLKLVVVAMVSMIAADFIYDLQSIHQAYSVGDPVDAGWLINYVLIGAAALHPANSARPKAVPRQPGDGRGELPAVALAGFVSPVILLAATVLGKKVDVAAQAVISLILFALVVLRMRWMVARITSQTHSLKDALATKEALENELRHQAFHDSLTGLANRALLHDRVDHALLASQRKEGIVALCFCDLDGFKVINDTLGHLMGDKVLIAVSRRLAAAVRPGDTVARLGGDEFAVLLENVESVAGAMVVAERLVSVLREPLIIEEHQLTISTSAGLAVADISATTEALLSQADSAMYEAKAGGKDRFEVFQAPMHLRISEQLEFRRTLEKGLRRGEFFLQYQPQFALRTGELIGFEALIRWNHPTLGLVEPSRFIPVAEETGHIVPLGRWVMEKACEQAAEWSSSNTAPLTMSVNLSGRQLKDPHLVENLRTTLSLSGLAPPRLILEITESVLIANTESLAVLSDLKSIGVRLAIDDFGTGYSSLGYLRQMPVDELKIDKSFVDTLEDPAGDGATYMTTIVGLARGLGLHTVAEGIETSGQHKILTDLGCDSGQGYLFARPLDREAARAFVLGSRGQSRMIDVQPQAVE